MLKIFKSSLLKKIGLTILIISVSLFISISAIGVNNYLLDNKTVAKIEEVKSKVKNYSCPLLKGDVVLTLEDGTKVTYPVVAFDGLIRDCDEEYLKEAKATERVLTFEKITYKTGNSKLVLIDEEF